jgi:hypothetical protein
MDDILLVFCWLFIALLIHVVLYRLFFRWKIILGALGSIYFLGIPILIVKHIYFPLPGVFSTRKLWKKKELFDLFSEKNLIDKRLETLKEKKLIKEKNGIFSITWKGNLVYSLILFSFVLTGMEAGG